MRHPTLDRPPLFQLDQASGGHVVLSSDCAAVAHVFVLEEDIVRLLVLPEGRLKQARTWAIAPGQDDVADEGRDRMDMAGFACPAVSMRQEGRTLALETRRNRLTIDLDGLKCRCRVVQRQSRKSRPCYP